MLVWANSINDSDNAPDPFFDITGWECSENCIHIEDFVPIIASTVHRRPCISADDQRLLLLQGLAFAREVGRVVNALTPPSPVRCIIGVNDTNATFRFHQIRTGEYWNVRDLDSYEEDRVIVVDIEPSGI